MTLCTFDIISVINLCFSLSAGIRWMVFLFCPLKPQLVKADGHPSWVWFCQRFLPVKRESFLSTVATGTLRTGDWSKEKFRCNLLVYLARKLFLNWLCMYELDKFWISRIGLDYDYNELDTNWLELAWIIEVAWDDICCDLAQYE